MSAEHLVLFFPVGEVTEVDHVLIGAARLVSFPRRATRLFSIGVRKSAQQHSIDDAKDRGIRTDAQRERKQRDERHHRTLQQHPHAKANVRLVCHQTHVVHRGLRTCGLQ